jgi:hypothetical protein
MLLRLGLSVVAVTALSACNLKLGQQVDKLLATYWVHGKDAAQVEQYLTKTYQMAPLIFQCCGWVSTYGGGKPARDGEGTYWDKNRRQFDISMASVETVEKDWKKIPRFNVRIETYLGEI